MTPEDLKLQDLFCDNHDLKNLIKEPNCLKGKNLSCIDLILANQKQIFMKSRSFIRGISNFRDFPVDTGRKLNVHKTFKRRPGRLLNVLCTFN